MTGDSLSFFMGLVLFSLIPFLFMSLTSYLKISTVLSVIKNAIGAENILSSTIIITLSIALSFLAMAPVAQRIENGLTPILHAHSINSQKKKENNSAPASQPILPPPLQSLSELESFGRYSNVELLAMVSAIAEPMRQFLEKHSSQKERLRFLDIAKRARLPEDKEKVQVQDFSILAPAFVVTELTEAFAIGFLIFLPFLVIDLLVSNILSSLGMTSLSSSQLAMPLKLLLFVAIDGLGLISQALVAGYN